MGHEIRTITGVTFNWRFSTENGEEFSSFTVGIGGVTEIEEHSSLDEGDRWFYNIHFENGTMQRIFYPNQVFFSEFKPVKPI